MEQYIFVQVMNDITIWGAILLALITSHFLCYYFGHNYGRSINRFFRYCWLKAKRFMQGRHNPDKSEMKLNT